MVAWAVGVLPKGNSICSALAEPRRYVPEIESVNYYHNVTFRDKLLNIKILYALILKGIISLHL